MLRTVLTLLGIAALVPFGDVSPTPAASLESETYVVGEAIIASPAAPFGVVMAPAASAAAAAAGCTDRSYALSKWALSSSYQWYYNAAGTPASVSSTALTAIKNGSQTVAAGRNRCGTTPKLTTTQTYLGATTKTAQVSSTGTCTGNDGVSVTSWGNLPPSYLAYTCVYYRANGTVVASDMLIDNKVHKWATTLPASCTDTFDLESVIVHERGHTAGIDHVSQTTSGLQTMSPKTQPCATNKRLLAAGDLAGLTARYSA